MESSAAHVVLLDQQGQPCGTERKDRVHSPHTPLHLGFSCHVLNAAGEVLVTRRALNKRTWPGVWTNSFCGHPQPSESLEEAVHRHARHELGMQVGEVSLELPDFRYQATDASGVVENEICPVFSAVSLSPTDPDPAEVCELRWVAPANLAAAIEAAPWAFSPWLVSQAQQMAHYQSRGDAAVRPRGH
ncbi:isopentenyl-diphosphate Delta-isomerase [Nesterenkonia sphaerica]|uniref:Isopentenyl-diphosphate Delta-isomerase n=1 Tax=Nesterenkonia sphaerica TaxID=1804988 RepID=A0A5R9A6B5_9MICC|nr:isopentenyl-diphosphate Delta-isomerase [Nesterenkonia sphaerica]TLP74070.1 isopentenyl-diphosphate Delta-isomerase [Nesterenkonia sphaerica]